MTDQPTIGVTVENADGVRTITIDRPDKLNALTPDAMAALVDAVSADGCRVIVLTGAGRAFCTGADLGVDPRGSGEPESGTLELGAKLIARITEVDAIVITKINGPAAGIGASIALAGDLPVMSEQAFLLLPFTDIGLLPDGGATGLWPAAAGRVHAMRAALLADRISAPEALAAGLVAATVPADELDGFVADWVSRLLARPRVALARTKQAINGAALAQLPAAVQREITWQNALLAAPDFAEGAQAFLERREPRFTD